MLALRTQWLVMGLSSLAQGQAQRCSVAGWACTHAGDLCVQRKLHAKSDMWSAVSACAANGAHVCTRGDLLAACGIEKFEAFGVDAGWFGDRVPAPKTRGGQRWFHAWNERDYCMSHGHTGMSAQLLPASTELPFRCCRPRPSDGRGLAKTGPARACPSGWHTDRSSTCMMQKPRPAATYFDAMRFCQSEEARVCALPDMLTACGSVDPQDALSKTNPFYGMSDPHETWWMGTPRAEGGIVTWRGDNCDEIFANNQGQPKPASSKYAYKCCKGEIVASTVNVPKGWACTASGDVCAQKKLNKAGGMDWEAVKVCGKLQAHVCTHADTVALCGAKINPFQGTKRGWLGNVARAAEQKFEFGTYFTWAGDTCGRNNMGTPSPSTTSLSFRCCRGAPQSCSASSSGGSFRASVVCNTAAQFARLNKAVNARCCGDGGCQHGVPRRCSASCASVLVPMQKSCAAGFLKPMAKVRKTLSKAAAACDHQGGH